MLVKALVGFFAFILSDLVYAAFKDWNRDRILMSSFGDGSCPSVAAPKVLVDRSEELNKVVNYLQLPLDQGRYSFICGEHGTGKTSLVLEACRKIGPGCVYVSVPDEPQHFGTVLAEAIHFDPTSSITFIGALHRRLYGIDMADKKSTPDHISHHKVFPALLEAAAYFKSCRDPSDYTKMGEPILVIDNINVLAQKDPQMLAYLQSFAKRHADQRDLTVVFVSSEGLAPRQMSESSAWSRARLPLVIGDISDSQAQDYLERMGVPKDFAQKAVKELTGGRFGLLGEVSSSFTQGVSYEVIRKVALGTVKSRFQKEGIIPGTGDAKDKLVRHMASSPDQRVPIDLLMDDLKLSQEEISNIFRPNIFSFNPVTLLVSFQSRAVQTYVKENFSN